ncbi:hypothetical protein INR49_003501 [Caranx melampygus]|nr:hypothetical protein INR49_003501 [Caranx melampygus]
MADTTSSPGENCLGRMKVYVRTQKGTILAAEIVFGLVCGLVFAYDTYTIFLELKSSRQHTAASTDYTPFI